MLKSPDFPLANYLPKDQKPRIAIFADIPAVIARFKNVRGKPAAVAFRGKSRKPAFYYSFKDAEQLERHVKEWLAAQRAHAQIVKDRRAEQNQPHSLKVGQVLYASWGYDQTNIDFYEVTKIIGDHFLEIREIGKRISNNTERGIDYVMPMAGQYKSEPMRRRSNKTNYVRIDNSSSAHPWDGEPKYQTAAGWGH